MQGDMGYGYVEKSTLLLFCSHTYMPAQDKTNNKTCVASNDTDQPVHPPITAKVLAYPSLDSLVATEDTISED